MPLLSEKLVIGQRVKINGAGNLIGLVVDYWDNGQYVVGFSDGKEYVMGARFLIKHD